MRYQLYYWPGIQGRGEFVRLALEEAAAPYVDVAVVPERRGGGVPAILKVLESRGIRRPPFAPPILQAGQRLIAQTPNILLFLGASLKLAPSDAAGRLWAHQLGLTILDLYLEIFHTHHPLGDGYAYEEQKSAAKRRTRDFLDVRLPKFIGYFERVLEGNGARAARRRLRPAAHRSLRRIRTQGRFQQRGPVPALPGARSVTHGSPSSSSETRSSAGSR